jgi:hypothetical protein
MVNSRVGNRRMEGKINGGIGNSSWLGENG